MSAPETGQPSTGSSPTSVINGFFDAIGQRWLLVFNLLVAIYVFLPILAPVLMSAGASGPARLIYTAYSPMCHQMASRSWFLLGEQAAYPRALAGTDFVPIEAYMADVAEFAGVSPDPANWPGFLLPARRFLGNETMGYKMALCERDIAIYSFVLLGGLIYAVLRRRGPVRPLPFLAFILIGLAPIGLDGFSQLISQYGVVAAPEGLVSSLLPLRESTPLLRTFTGALFGFTLVWLTYPRIDGSKNSPRREQRSD